MLKYTLSDENAWTIEYSATTDQDTIINLHTYWNLNGFANDEQDILGHVLAIDADTCIIYMGEKEGREGRMRKNGYAYVRKLNNNNILGHVSLLTRVLVVGRVKKNQDI